MFSVHIEYDVAKRILKDASGRDNYCIGTVGDNNGTALIFHIIDPNNELEGYSGRAEFGIEVQDGAVSHRPYIPLDSDNKVILTDEIMRNTKRSALPVQLVYEDDGGHVFASFNMLTYTVTNAVN